MNDSLSARRESKGRPLPAYLKGFLRRQKELLFPHPETIQYRKWMRRHRQERQQRFANISEPGLLSMLTAVWNGSPVHYLKQLAESIIPQNREGHGQWVILDNGCSRPELLNYFGELRQYDWIKIHRSPTNLGIVPGLRLCLQAAGGRYILPIDADDLLYPDALRIITFFIRQAGYPALLYTDEDKIAAGGITQPYFKPDWDPVLLANSAYIAHLGVVDRRTALELDAYTDKETEGSPDWDLFIRFANTGHEAVRIPEVVYSWRVHAYSTADDAGTKPYVISSQKAAVARFLGAQAHKDRFSLQNSELLPGAAHWRFVRRQSNPKPMLCILLETAPTTPDDYAPANSYPCLRFARLPVQASLLELKELLLIAGAQDSYICFLGADVSIQNPDWPWEALGLFELFPDTAMIGGRIWNEAGTITNADRHFGFGGPCGCPNRGRSDADPGYFAQMWKQRSVSAVSLQFAVTDTQYLLKVLHRIPAAASVAFGGAWIGAEALRDRRRVIYTPFLSGISNTDWEKFVTPHEQEIFLRENADAIPDRRYYPHPFSLQRGFALEDG